MIEYVRTIRQWWMNEHETMGMLSLPCTYIHILDVLHLPLLHHRHHRYCVLGLLCFGIFTDGLVLL